MRFVRLFILALTVVILSCQKDGYHIAFLISGEGRTKKVEGFLQGLKALNIKISSYKVYNGENNLSELERKARLLASDIDKYDLVATGGSIETYILKNILGENIKKPIVVMGGTALKTWGITHEFKKPSYPITGVDNLNAELMEKRLELFSKLFPDVKKVVVFCTPRFEASKEATRRAIKAGQVHGIKVVPVSVDNANDLEYIISHMREDGFGGILLTPCFYTENFLQSYILYYASFYSIPVMCLSPDQVKQGCPVAYGTSQFEQGYQAAFIAYRIFSGEDVRNIPFEPVRNVKLAINFSAFRELGYYNNPYVFMLAQTVE